MSATLEAFLIKEDGYVLSMMKQLASEVKVSEENMVLGLKVVHNPPHLLAEAQIEHYRD